MSAEQNKALFRRVMDEVFVGGNTSLIDELFAPNFVEHEELPPGIPAGAEGVKQLSSMFLSAFPDFKATIEDLIAEGDKVVARATWSGTHQGEFMGIPPTGKRISIQVIDIVRFAGGKFVEHWGQMDNMTMMQQLGVMPGPGEEG
ncbi:MAG: ester cyclase [Anaerolineales bacterium]|nr:MAG: ester cyclase [Anaerolineales bacterium]